MSSESIRIDVRERIAEAMGPRFIYAGAKQWEAMRADKEFMKSVTFVTEGNVYYNYSRIMKLEIIVVECDSHINVA